MQSLSKDNCVEVLQKYADLERRYYKELNAIGTDEDTDNNVKQVFDVIQSFSTEIEQFANFILGESSSNITDDFLDIKPGVTYVDESLKQYVQANSTYLRRKKLIKSFDTCSVNCLVCNRVIKGLGLLDWNDAGTNAICFNCIDSNVYVGDGIYFTQFD